MSRVTDLIVKALLLSEGGEPLGRDGRVENHQLAYGTQLPDEEEGGKCGAKRRTAIDFGMGANVVLDNPIGEKHSELIAREGVPLIYITARIEERDILHSE